MSRSLDSLASSQFQKSALMEEFEGNKKILEDFFLIYNDLYKSDS